MPLSTLNALSSRNVAVEGSVGFVKTSDPSYTSLPADSRKPPAPIDPSSEFLSHHDTEVIVSNRLSVSKWFYISSAQV